MNKQDLPKGWYANNKDIEIGSGLSLVLFDMREVSMGNDMGRLAICRGDSVMFASVALYPAWEGPVVIGNRFVIYNHTKRLSDSPYRGLMQQHVFDTEKMAFCVVDHKIIETGGYIYLKDIKFRMENDSLIIDEKSWDIKALDWDSIKDLPIAVEKNQE
jgi:hypothetical protein